jgi:hypothetical protein
MKYFSARLIFAFSVPVIFLLIQKEKGANDSIVFSIAHLSNAYCSICLNHLFPCNFDFSLFYFLISESWMPVMPVMCLVWGHAVG